MSGTKVVHRFIRNANIESNIYNRVANRHDPFKNTLTVLKDPKHDRTLTLIGTTNSSTTLAHRTKNLLEQLKPDAVYVQTSWDWWQYAKKIDVDNQELFGAVAKSFPQTEYKHQNHLRGILFRLRYAIWKSTLDGFLQFPEDFNFFSPGLETYFACRYACRNNVRKYYGGVEFDPQTIEAFRLQPDLYPHTFIYRFCRILVGQASSLTNQHSDFIDTMEARGGQAFAESIDRSRINFLVGYLNKLAPKQKKILVDERDIRIFSDIYNMKDHKNIVAVVNQWHMEGVETHWRRQTKTLEEKPQLSPVHDMPIDEIQEENLVNDWLRDYVSEVTKSEPATHQNYLTHYHKEVFEYERTRHTHHVTHEDIPEPGEKGHHHH